MSLVTLVYASRAASTPTEAELILLLGASRDRNMAAGVTGMLVYAYDSYLQQLEGEQAAVEEIYASIARDPRHNDLRVLTRRPVDERRFGDWAMGFAHTDAAALQNRLTGFRAAIRYPLVNSTIVGNGAIAEDLLMLMAERSSV